MISTGFRAGQQRGDAKGLLDGKGQSRGGADGKRAVPPTGGRPDGAGALSGMSGLGERPTNLSGGNPTDLPGGRSTSHSSATGAGRDQSLQVEHEDLVMFDADGSRVLIRPVINPGLKTGQGNRMPQAQVQAGGRGAGAPPLQRPAAANVATIIPGGIGALRLAPQ